MNRENFLKLPDYLPKEEEYMQILANGKGARIERVISCGHVSPPDFWYQLEEDEWVLVLQGEAELELERSTAPGSGRRVMHLSAGEYVLLPARRRHRVTYTSTQPPCIWLCVFGQLKEDLFAGLPGGL